MTVSNRFYLGLDLGSTTIKAVLLDNKLNIKEQALIPTGTDPKKSALALQQRLLNNYQVDNLTLIATGYGRSLVENANKTVTEITCHAKGVKHLHQDAVTILDIGGQDAKAIRLNNNGDVEDFAMNDRCAAGTGSFLDLMANKFSLNINQLSDFCQNTPEPALPDLKFEISSTCVVFAESEVIGLTAKGIPAIEALRAVHRAIAKRVALLLRQVKAEPPLYFSGGVAQNTTLRLALEKELGYSITPARFPQFMGALGAALQASEYVK